MFQGASGTIQIEPAVEVFQFDANAGHASERDHPPIGRPANQNQMKQIKKPSKQPVIQPSIIGASHDSISERAFAIWLSEGSPENRAVENWQQAETEILSDRNSLLYAVKM